MIEQPSIVTTTAKLAAVVHLEISRNEIESAMGDAVQEVLNALTEQKLSPAGPFFAHHLTQSSERFDCEVGFPVATEISPVGRVISSNLPGTTAARTVYTGDYAGLFEAWREFGRRSALLLESRGYRHGKTLWEIYTLGPETDPNPEVWKTELYQSLISTGSADGSE